MSKCNSQDKKRFDRLYCIPIKQEFIEMNDQIVGIWGSKALRDDQVTDIGRQLLGKKYLGTYPIDKIPLSKSDKYMIINVDRAGLPGSHWCGLYIKGATIYIYDSFARQTKRLLKPLYDKAKKVNKTIIDVNSKSDQKNNTEICGPLSLSFLYIIHKHGVQAGRYI